MNLSDADVLEIIRLLDASGYRELDIETADLRLVLRRGEGQTGWTRQRTTLAKPHRADAPSSAVPADLSAGAMREPGSMDKVADWADDGLSAIRSPMIGTFYRAPRPGSDPFVQPGSQVQPDTVVAIIEVMKLMNSVAAGMDGEVVEVVVEDGQLVQKGQCLMRVRPLNNPLDIPLNTLEGLPG
jgi:acetyl-CoA carboxylase biotin carboxyl carrier protein